MKVNVVYYGGLKRDVGARRETLELAREALTIGELGDTLRERYPALAARLHTVAYVVNDSIVDADFALHDGDEASLLPPVSGG